MLRKSAVVAGERRIEMKLSTLTGLVLGGALAIGSAAPAMAQNYYNFDPYYFTPKILYSHTKLTDFSSGGNVSGQYINHSSGTYKENNWKDGTFGGGFAVGYDFGAYSEYPIRVELEYLHRGSVKAKGSYKMTANYGSGSSTNIQGSDARVSATVQTLLTNFYLDFPTDSDFTPYIGLGIGGAYVDAKVDSRFHMTLGSERGYYVNGPGAVSQDPDNFPAEDAEPIIRNTYNYDGPIYGQQSSWNLAWQASAGFSYQIKDNIALDVSYRYSDFGQAKFGTSGFRFSGREIGDYYVPESGAVSGQAGTNVNKELARFSTKSEMDLKAHEVIVGLRISAF